MKKSILIFAVIFIIFSGCKEEIEDNTGTVIGTINTDLDLNWDQIRAKEMPAGNLVTDAIYWYLKENGKNVDVSFFNGGSIRVDTLLHKNGIIPAGEITDSTIWQELLPFNNEIIIATLTGTQLKEILERSVSVLPDWKGWFLQVSKEGKIEVDISQTAQTVTGLTYEEEIETPGERIISFKINGVEINDEETYRASFHAWLGDGGDSYVTLRKLPDDKKEKTGIIDAKAVEEYIKAKSSVTPVVEERIVIN